jgi:hypothetical protein
MKGFKLLEGYLDDEGHARGEVEDALVETYRTLEYHTLEATGILSHRLYAKILGREPVSKCFNTIEEAREALQLNSAQALYIGKRFWFEGDNIPSAEFGSTGGRLEVSQGSSSVAHILMCELELRKSMNLMNLLKGQEQ